MTATRNPATLAYKIIVGIVVKNGRGIFRCAILILAAGIASAANGVSGQKATQHDSVASGVSVTLAPAGHHGQGELARGLSANLDDDSNDDDAQPALSHISANSSILHFAAWVFECGAECHAVDTTSSPTRGPPLVI